MRPSYFKVEDTGRGQIRIIKKRESERNHCKAARTYHHVLALLTLKEEVYHPIESNNQTKHGNNANVYIITRGIAQTVRTNTEIQSTMMTQYGVGSRHCRQEAEDRFTGSLT